VLTDTGADAPALEQRGNNHFFPRQTQLFFSTLHAEHSHAVGEFGAGGDLLSPQFICDVPVVIADY
jgi:hypothetical protein